MKTKEKMGFSVSKFGRKLIGRLATLTVFCSGCEQCWFVHPISKFLLSACPMPSTGDTAVNKTDSSPPTWVLCSIWGTQKIEAVVRKIWSRLVGNMKNKVQKANGEHSVG